MKELQQKLRRIDRKGYKAYHDIRGRASFPKFDLFLDHIQADPYASPSRVRVILSMKKLSFDESLYVNRHRNVAFTDFIARAVGTSIRKHRVERSLYIDEPGQEILERTAVVCNKNALSIRLSLHLPARGRTILGEQARKLLTEQLPAVISDAIDNLDHTALHSQVELSDDQLALREFVKEEKAVAFIADGAILPRASGVSNRPLKGGKHVPFDSPSSLSIEVVLPHRGTIRGMLVRAGVTLIVGGGYHGKSTLLQAMEQGVYDHVAGDGREYVVTLENACKIRAEDGRSVTNVNISPFIGTLPNGKSTTVFSSENASGSTSQATNIIEALEAGSKLLLIDEDTSATNFMIRDGRMQQLVASEKEPITPFIDRVRELYERHGVSTIIVVGGTGDYFEVADTIIMMDEYTPHDVTRQAKDIVNTGERRRTSSSGAPFQVKSVRSPDPKSFDAYRGKREKVDARGRHTILYGRETIDLTAVEQCVDNSQTRAMARAIHWLAREHMNGKTTISELLDIFEQRVRTQNLDSLSPFKGKHPGDLALPRRYELAAALNRLRKLKTSQHDARV